MKKDDRNEKKEEIILIDPRIVRKIIEARKEVLQALAYR